MPTTKPRHSVTETDAVAAALDAAAERWPEDRANRAKLLVHLVEEGRRKILDEEEERKRQRLEALKATAGSLTGCYPEGYLEELRAGWPD